MNWHFLLWRLYYTFSQGSRTLPESLVMVSTFSLWGEGWVVKGEWWRVSGEGWGGGVRGKDRGGGEEWGWGVRGRDRSGGEEWETGVGEEWGWGVRERDRGIGEEWGVNVWGLRDGGFGDGWGGRSKVEERWRVNSKWRWRRGVYMGLKFT